MAILKSKSGSTFDTETRIRTNSDGSVTNLSNTPSNIIPPKTLTGTNVPMTFPPSATDTGTVGASGFIESNNQSIIKEQAKIAEAEQAKLASGENEITNLIKTLGTSGQMQEEAYKTEGVDTAKKQLDEYTSQIEAEQLANRRQIEKLQKENPQGLFGGALQQEVSRLERESLSKQADLAILQTAALRRYDTGKAIADRQVEIQLEPLKAELEAKKFIYENNKDIFTKAEDRAFQTKLTADERNYETEKKRLEDISNIKLEAAKNGASVRVLNALSNAKTLDEAITIAGSSLVSPMEKLQMEKLRGDIAKNTAELVAAKQTIGGTTGSPVGDIIAGSSRFGDKRLTDSQLEKIQKATNALGSMETLQGLLSQGKDGVNLSGPVTGRLRTLATQLGGDANASAINATIQGLIPTVARGIFGEVGVLTDADIENYRKTVPNLKATGEQNKLISLVMYDVLSRSLENTLVTNAQNQTNVSGFLTSYQDAKTRINTLKSNLGVVEAVPITPVNKAKMENAWSTQLSPENISNSLNGFFQ